MDNKGLILAVYVYWRPWQKMSSGRDKHASEVVQQLVLFAPGLRILPRNAVFCRAKLLIFFVLNSFRHMRSQALATVRSEYPRRLTEAIVGMLVAGVGDRGNSRSPTEMPGIAGIGKARQDG
jgi:hypothetical protein